MSSYFRNRTLGARAKTLAKWFAATSSFIFVLARFLPSNTPRRYGVIEDSWTEILHMAFAERLQFGQDIVFTFGPWGFLYGGWNSATHSISIVVWAALSIVFWWVAWRVATHFFKNTLISWLWLLAVISLASISLSLNMDARLSVWPLLLLLLHFFVEEHPFTATEAMLVISLGLLSLIKHSIFTIAAMSVLIIAVDNVFRHRRFPWALLVFGASVSCFWIAAGQRLSSFGPFLRTSSEVVSGYTEAMMWDAATDKVDIARFWAIATSVCALAGFAAWRRHRLFGLLPFFGLGFILFTAFKYGYVRHDGHEVAATLLLLLAGLLWLPSAWFVDRQKARWIIPAILLLVSCATALASLTFSRHSSVGLFSTLAQTLSVRNLFAPASLLLDRQQFARSYKEYLQASFVAYAPSVKIEGTGDVYPLSRVAALGQGVACRPRPVFQSYCAYTARLAQLNAAHLRGERAADHILFDVSTIDGRFPTLDDGLSWPDLLTRYDITDFAGAFIVMAKSATPRRYELTPIGQTLAGFGEKIEIPRMIDGPIWVTVDVRPSLYGNILGILYRPPGVSLTVATRSGKEYGGRILTAVARAGFLVSPFIENRQSFAALASAHWQSELAELEIASARITTDAGAGLARCYQSPVKIRFYRLEFPRQDLTQLNNNR